MERIFESPSPIEPALLSPEELATYLGCGRTYAYSLLSDGSIPSIKLGRLRRIRRRDADAFIGQLVEHSHQERRVDM